MGKTDSKKISTLTLIILGFCLSILIYAFSLGINGNDFWWHIKAGDWMISNKKIPTHDIFSWYASSNNFYWFSHEWLSEVLLSAIFSLGGSLGVFIFSLLMAIIILMLFFYAAREYFDLNRDYAKIKKELLKRDKQLKDAIHDKGGVRILNQEF